MSEWYERARAKINEFSSFSKNWTSYNCQPPSGNSIEISHAVLSELAKRNLKPQRIAPAADGGVVFRITKDALLVRIVVENDGILLVAFVQVLENRRKKVLVGIDAETAATLAQNFLEGRKA